MQVRFSLDGGRTLSQFKFKDAAESGSDFFNGTDIIPFSGIFHDHDGSRIICEVITANRVRAKYNCRAFCSLQQDPGGGGGGGCSDGEELSWSPAVITLVRRTTGSSSTGNSSDSGALRTATTTVVPSSSGSNVEVTMQTRKSLKFVGLYDEESGQLSWGKFRFFGSTATF